MNFTVKSLIISLIISLVTALTLGFVQTGQMLDPLSPTGIATLVIVFIAIVVRSMIGNQSNANGASRNASTASSKASSATAPSSSEGETGTVKWFNVKKGYGFITRDQGDDVFVHYRNIQGSGRKVISDGQRVKFIVIDGDKGLQADEVEAL